VSFEFAFKHVSRYARGVARSGRPFVSGGAQVGGSPRSATMRGRVVAHLLAGSWRAAPPLVDVDLSTLAEVTSLMGTLGVGGLAWWKLLHSGLGEVADAESARRAYRADAIQAALHLHSIRVLVSRLRAAGIEPIVIKGWSTARLYPEPGLRPYVDLDLVVPPGLGASAETILQDDGGVICPDHADVLDASTWTASGPHGPQGDLADHPWEAVRERSRLVALGELRVRVLGPEDHLRLSAVHAFRHGFISPKWLCDIGLLVERLPHDFDWSYCLAGDPRHTEQLLRTLGLAHHTLGADVHSCPGTAKEIPPWLSSSVFRRWGMPRVEGPGPSLLSGWRQPSKVRIELCRRWPDPLESTLRLGLGLTGHSRSAAQVCDFVWRFGILSAIRHLRRKTPLRVPRRYIT